MKLVIQTQIKENYNVENPADGYWKNKGGSTFVYPNLTAANIARIENEGIENLRGLIECDDTMIKEWIVDWHFAEDDAEVCAEWETPYELFYADGAWHYKHHQFANEYNIWANNIVEIFRSWKMLPSGRVTDFFERYVYASGEHAITTPSNDLEGYVTD